MLLALCTVIPVYFTGRKWKKDEKGGRVWGREAVFAVGLLFIIVIYSAHNYT